MIRPDIIVPFIMDYNWPAAETIIQTILEQKEKYGITKFMLTGPNAGWRASGIPSMDFYRKQAEFFAEIRDAVKPHGIECGWWLSITVKSGPSKEATRMIRSDGSETPMASCPLNPDFRKTLAERAALFVKIAKPAFAITEDDFSVCAATGPDGCFCKYHLAEFARRQGRKSYTREELLALFAEHTPEAEKLKNEWRELMRDSLVGLASAIRTEIDKENPEVPIGTMQSGAWDLDGDATEAVTRAIAGKRHTPFCRLYGTFYGGESITDIPGYLFHALWSKQRISGDFLFYHESDTYPHTRFFTSGACMRVIMTTAYAWGFDGSTFQTAQLLDDANEETSYGTMYAQEQARFQAVSLAAKQCTVKGVRIRNILSDGVNNEDFKRPLSAFGIPYTTLDASVTFLEGAVAGELEDAEIMQLLSGGLFLDGVAAKALYDRGYGKYLGVKVEDDPVKGMDRFDLAGREIIEDGIVPDSRGRMMELACNYSPHGNGKLFALVPDGCEVLTKMRTYRAPLNSAGMTRFVNELGGRIVILGQGIGNNHAASLFNYRRQKLFQEQILWCGSDDTVFVKNTARVFPVMDEAENPEKAGFTGMLVLTNLNPDALDSMELHLPEKWKKCSAWKRLDSQGKWMDQEIIRIPGGIRLPVRFDYARPEVFLAV